MDQPNTPEHLNSSTSPQMARSRHKEERSVQEHLAQRPEDREAERTNMKTAGEKISGQKTQVDWGLGSMKRLRRVSR